ncbi:PREDICTED: beta-adaptin-like protein C [Brassica oleracea var. oleracea]|uniref:Beta-adaptin-like protein n=1 Tax=Brassica oleracea var. oleracea TaxID=109376 RepID=A0A0D3DFN0_BRAOL|nr:PREDICTED: beta-adaptin-like protein C [Brassica oleracea var. oleracea]
MSGHDSKYFSTTKKGEIPELKEELNSQYKDKRKDAVKKVIAAMTVGKDVSSLFTDVLNCMQTENLELKKLVYLYLINYAKSQPDLAILAVNTFVKDSQDPNPLIRALAVRTMGCIRVDKITEYLCDPLQKCLKDDDPYVRKTAAVCVAKLFDINAELVEDRGFLEALKDLISDNNPMVVANAVAALAEIQDKSASPIFEINSVTLTKLLTALNECTEWGQVFILDSLSRYKAADPREAENIVERVTPRLQHANCAVVLSAVKMILQQMELITSTDVIRNLCKKMAPPLVTLLSAEPEIQYVALRNINLIVQKRPTILAHEIKVFFCKYNDPIYVKMEKLEIMIKLASDRNIDQVLLEFKEYATEVDVDFVRKAVRAIGRCAIKLERAAERCISVLLELIKIKVNYVVQEAIIVIKDIFRRYPNTYESIIATLCESLDTLDEPEAKASMIWIIGEYAERIDNADELLESFLENFPEEPAQVQLQLLTATVKLFLKKPTEGPQQMIQVVLNNATVETDNPDLRDRAYIYWRLLSTDPEAAKDVVLAEKPVITDDSNQLEPSLLDELLANISTLSSVYHKPPEAFVTRLKPTVQKTEDEDYVEGGETETSGNPVDGAAPVAAAPAPVPDLLGDLMGTDDAAIVPVDDYTTPSGPPLPVVLPASSGQGLQISAQLTRQDGQVFYSMLLENNSQSVLDGFMIQFNKNSFGLAAAGPLQVQPLQPGESARTMLPMVLSQNMSDGPTNSLLQVAVKNNQPPVKYFTDKIVLHALFSEDGRMERGTFLETWRSLPDSNEVQKDFPGITITSIDSTLDLLAASNMFFIAKRKNGSQDVLYLSARVPQGVPFLIELTAMVGQPGLKCAVKTPTPEIAPLFFESLEMLFKP